MYKYLYILIFFNSCLLFSQQGWFWQSPLPQGNDINCVYWLNSSTAFAAGNCGTILKSTNKGNDWVAQFHALKSNLNVIEFIDENTGIAAGGIILRTTNSGQNWIMVDSLYGSFLAIDFVNSSTGWLQKSSYDELILYKTTNAGTSWQLSPTYINAGSANKCMDWISSDTGWVGAGNTIYKTTNGGESWQPKITITSQASNITFFNSLTGWFKGSLPSGTNTNGIIYKTSDGGISWSAAQYSISGYINNFVFTDINTGYALGYLGNYPSIYKTINGGLNWTKIFNTTRRGGPFYTISKSQNDLIAAGDEGLIYISGNNGSTWDSICYDFSNTYDKPSFINDNTGWAISCGWSEPSSVSKTTDGGFTWQKKLIDSNINLDALYFLNENTGWAANSRRILKTTDGGSNWVIKYETDSSISFNGFCFLNAQTGFAGSEYNGIYKTTDAGENWQKVSNLSPERFFFINENTGWAVRYYRFLYKTTNGGYTWIQNNSIQWNHSNSYKLQFINENTGFLASFDGLFRSINGGTNWSHVYTNVSSEYIDFSFAPSGKIWAMDGSGTVISSYDMGNSWQENYLPSNGFEQHHSIIFTSENTGYVFGSYGKILKTTTASIGIKPISNNIPSSYHLYQNYPNPFNPSTNINFDIGCNEKVKAKIILYDMLGRRTAIMLDEELTPGEYNIKWNGANLASGIYFYRLTISNGQLENVFSETKKMVLLK